MKPRSTRRAIALALVLAGCSSAVTATTTTTTMFKGVPDPWPVTCGHVVAIGDAWQPIDEYLDEQRRKSANGWALERDLSEESEVLVEVMVRASVEGAALTSEGDSWADVLRLYADDVLSWFPDVVGDARRSIGQNDAFNFDHARYTVLEERCAAIGGDVPEGNIS